MSGKKDETDKKLICPTNGQMTSEQIEKWRKNMQGKSAGKSQASVVIDSAVHTYIVYNLALRHISQTAAARICGCSPQFLNLIIRGARRSAVIQTRFATQVMGYRSWQDLEARALLFQERVMPLLKEDRDAM